jgi:hypothetical protein
MRRGGRKRPICGLSCTYNVVSYVGIFFAVTVNKFEPNRQLSAVVKLAILAAVTAIILQQTMP